MEATVLITTKNRSAELRRAVDSALRQTAVAEVIVIDDGSTDGTAAMLEREFPAVRLHRSEESRGYVVQRNVGMSLATKQVVVTIDDDAAFASPRTVAQTLEDFDDPRIGAVVIPHIDIGIRETPYLEAPRPIGTFVTSEFFGGSCAIRRDVFATVGGYRDSIFHQGEERDFCIRMLERGWVVRLGRADPIHHYPSVLRDVRRMDLYGRRNSILYAWHNEPWPDAAVRVVEMTVKGIGWGVVIRRPLTMLLGLAQGYHACWLERRNRAPVPRGINRVFRRLWKRGPLPLTVVEPMLPPLRTGASPSASKVA